MSVSSSTSRIQYVGNASTVTAYAIPFFFRVNSDLVVVLTSNAGVETTLALTTDYTLTGQGVAAGGELVTVAAHAADTLITIYREVPATQTTSYAANDAFPHVSHENALDKLTHLCQQVARKVGQCFKLTEASGDAAAVAKVASSVIGLNSSGNPVFRTASELVSFLSLSTAILNLPLSTWADAGERAVKVPDFIGQLGFQRDTKITYYSTATTAGSWTATPANAASAANLIYSGPSTGAAAAPTFRALVAADIPASGVTALKLGTAGMVMQSVSNIGNSDTGLTVAIPYDDTLPQITEGTQILTATITPSATTSKIRATFSSTVCHDTAAGQVIVALFNGAASAVAASVRYINTASVNYPLALLYESAAVGLLTPLTFTIRIGPSIGGNTVNLTGGTGGRRLGGAIAYTLVLEEIKA